MKTMVSVIIPFYHGSGYVPQLLQMMRNNAAVLRASTDTDLEVLLVNDSPEETIAVQEEMLFNLKIITNPKNLGIHASRVHGLEEARGEYILFLDQDDRITDNCLVSQLRAIGDADLVIGNGYDCEAGGGKHLIFQDAAHQKAAGRLSCHYYYNNLIRSPGQVLIRKASIPLYWTERILKNNGSDDAFLWILMLCRRCTAVINEDIVYEHVFTGENASGNDTAMLRSQMEVAGLLKGIASPMGLTAFQRRARYYCTNGRNHKLCFLDVGFSRMMYSKLLIRD